MPLTSGSRLTVLRRTRSSAEPLQHLARVEADRDLRAGDDEPELRALGEIAERSRSARDSISARSARGCSSRTRPAAGQGPRRRARCVYCGLAERKTSNGKPWRDLLRELVGAAERRPCRRVDPRQHLGERRRREHGRPALRSCVPRRSARRRRCTAVRDRQRRRRALPHRSTITLVDLTTPAALAPGSSPSSSADSRVMIATTRAGSVTSISTRARRPSTSTDRTTPRKLLRAESPSSVSAAQPLDLGRRHHAPVRAVALDPDLPLAIPATQRVEADPERA